MKKKLFSLLLAVVMLSSMMLMFASPSGAAEAAAPSLSLDYANLSFRDSICIKYAVRVENASGVKLLCWTTPQADYVKGTEEKILSPLYTQNISGKKYHIFDYEGLAARQMTDQIYVRAYAKVNGEDVYSNVRKYSILEYAYTMLGKLEAAGEESMHGILNSMLDYGAEAQLYLDYKTDNLANEPFYLVKLTEGAFSDGTTAGLYQEGDTVTVIAPETNEAGASFSHWADAKGNKVADKATATVEVKGEYLTLSPVYVKYSEGLAFESNGDGTCILIDVGDCTDTDVIVPPTALDGDSVVEIDASAFADTDITSITLPKSIESIGRRAFNNCASLTDVYYDGTAAEWENVYVNATGNDAFLNAAIHFLGATKYTVTFVDYNGTVLKTETVSEGEAATPPTEPTRDGYTFTGWDKAFDAVSEDLTVRATYALASTEPTIIISEETASAGDTVEITVAIQNNTDVASLVLDLAFDNTALTLTGVTYNTAIGGQTVYPDSLDSPVTLYWVSLSPATEDFVFVTLTFSVNDAAAAGDYAITLSYEADNVYDSAENNIAFDIINGKITVG